MSDDLPIPPLPGETPEQTKRRAKQAETAHAFHRDQIKAFLPTVITFGTEALKVTMVLNGAAAAAVLAYIGTGRQDVTAPLITALYYFGGGLLLGAFAHAASYLAQYAYHATHFEKRQTQVSPFIEWTDEARWWFKAGTVAHYIALALVLLSLSGAVVGFWSAASGLGPMPASQRPPDMSTTTPGSR